jgi:SAM-dependent methyltransferase
VAEGELWQQARIITGARVADIGCGPGAVLPVLAEVVGSTGSVAALDGDSDAVAVAAARTAASRAPNVSARLAETPSLCGGVLCPRYAVCRPERRSSPFLLDVADNPPRETLQS